MSPTTVLAILQLLIALLVRAQSGTPADQAQAVTLAETVISTVQTSLSSGVPTSTIILGGVATGTIIQTPTTTPNMNPDPQPPVEQPGATSTPSAPQLTQAKDVWALEPQFSYSPTIADYSINTKDPVTGQTKYELNGNKNALFFFSGISDRADEKVEATLVWGSNVFQPTTSRNRGTQQEFQNIAPGKYQLNVKLTQGNQYATFTSADIDVK